ncbi:MAG: hypothetical protein ABH863_04785 [Candidatus Micrarchaeota archaeon]
MSEPEIIIHPTIDRRVIFHPTQWLNRIHHEMNWPEKVKFVGIEENGHRTIVVGRAHHGALINYLFGRKDFPPEVKARFVKESDEVLAKRGIRTFSGNYFPHDGDLELYFGDSKEIRKDILKALEKALKTS